MLEIKPTTVQTFGFKEYQVRIQPMHHFLPLAKARNYRATCQIICSLVFNSLEDTVSVFSLAAMMLSDVCVEKCEAYMNF